MKKLLSMLMLLTCQAHADWMLNPYTQRMDYYEAQEYIYVTTQAVNVHLAALDLSTTAIQAELDALELSAGATASSLTVEISSRTIADSAIGVTTSTLRTDLAAVILSTQALSLATHLNTASALVKRDSSGNFSAGTITSAGIISSTSSFSGTVTVDYLSGVGANTPGDFKWKISVSSSCGDGWLRADGTSKSTTTYSALFTQMGYSFGGTGPNFSMPDMTNGEFIRAISTGTVGGNLTLGMGQKQLDELKSHSHSYQTGSEFGGAGVAYGDSASTIRDTAIQLTGGDETRPRNYAMIPCIFSGVK